jgi:penicillin-binding protein-related factor A (putative recombinase)
LECKSIEGNTFPIKNFTQYEKMKEKVGIHGVRAGVVLWFIEHKKVLYIPVSTFTKLIEDGKKSFNIKMVGSEEYFSLEIPGEVKRLFIDSDYSILRELEDGQ